MTKINWITLGSGSFTALSFVAKPEWIPENWRPGISIGLFVVTILLISMAIFDWYRKMNTKKGRIGKFVVVENGEQRFFGWRGQEDVHVIDREEPPRQLFNFFLPLCEAIRKRTDMEPQFNRSDLIRGEIVYEFSVDGRARWRLLGGMNGEPAEQVLTVVPRKRFLVANIGQGRKVVHIPPYYHFKGDEGNKHRTLCPRCWTKDAIPVPMLWNSGFSTEKESAFDCPTCERHWGPNTKVTNGGW